MNNIPGMFYFGDECISFYKIRSVSCNDRKCKLINSANFEISYYKSVNPKEYKDLVKYTNEELVMKKGHYWS